MRFHSIRWQLPISYASMALLAVVALGIVLLASLRTYYGQQERDYLIGNARTVSAQLALSLEIGAPLEALQSQLQGFAFLTQARVRLLDADGNLLADSGTAIGQQPVTTVSWEVETDSGSQQITRTVEESDGETQYRTVILIQDENSAGEFQMTERSTVTGNAALEGLDKFGVAIQLPTVGTLFGFDLDAQNVTDAARSDQIATHDIRDIRGGLLGSVELSEGPAYGQAILRSVAWGLVLASIVAVMLSAFVGWLISRRLSAPLLALTNVTARMASGELSARTEIMRRDETGALANSFNEMAQRMEETITTLRRFAGDAAHELHTPLTALRTSLEMATADQAAAGKYLQRAQAQVERLEHLTSSLLDLSRLESGTVNEERAAIDLTMLLQAGHEHFASRAEQAGLSFDLDLPLDSITIHAIDSQIQQAIGNLINNAIKFTPESGSLKVSLSRVDDMALLTVEDSGIGIPMADLPHLFERFYRGHNASDRPGSGLGLSIVRAIAHSHGGGVNAENTNTGTRFTLQLSITTSDN